MFHGFIYIEDVMPVMFPGGFDCNCDRIQCYYVLLKGNEQ